MTIHPRAIEMLTGDIERCQEVINEFADKLKASPVYGFEWAGRAAEAAIELEVYLVLKAWAEKKPEVTYEQFEEFLQEQVRRAIIEMSSTSAFSNATNLTKAQRLSSMLGSFGGMRGYFLKEEG